MIIEVKRKRKFRKGPVPNSVTDPVGTRHLYEEVGRAGIVIVADLARQMGWSYSRVCGKLPGLERLGLLLAEDGRGRLYQWGQGGSGRADQFTS